MDGFVHVFKVCYIYCQSTIRDSLGYVSENNLCICFEIGTVGDNSCYEYAACHQRYPIGLIFNIGDDSCRSERSCFHSGESKRDTPT